MTHHTPPANTTDLPAGYRTTELGPLPKEWQVVRLGEVVIKTELIDPRRMPKKRFKYIDVSSIDNEQLRILAAKEVQGEDAPSRARKGVRSGDVIFATVRPYLKRVAMVPHELDGQVCSTAFCVLRAGSRILSQYLFYAVIRDAFVEMVSARQRGSSYPAVTDKDVLQTPIPLPPLPEQRAIAHILRTVQEAREATVRVIAALRDLKRSLMRHLFTYGPVPVDAADQVELQDTPAGPIPAHWRVVRLGEVANLRKGSVHPSDVPNARYVGLEHLAPGEIRIRRFGRANATRSAKSVFEKGDILYGKLRPYLDKAAIAEWSGVCSTDILVLQPVKVTSLFLAYLMHTPSVLNHAIATTTGVNHPRTSWKALSQALIPLPPLDEQREIARILQAVDRKIEAEEARKEALDDLFRSLLHHLMTAKIRLPADFIAQFANGDTT